jgi:hypothetical protein
MARLGAIGQLTLGPCPKWSGLAAQSRCGLTKFKSGAVLIRQVGHVATDEKLRLFDCNGFRLKAAKKTVGLARVD